MRIKKILPLREFQVGKKKNKIFLRDTLNIKGLKLNNKIIIKNDKMELNYLFLNDGFSLDENLLKKNKSYFFEFIGNNKSKIHLALVNYKKKNLYIDYCKKEELKRIKIKKLLSEL